MRISSTKMFAVYTLGGEYGHITRACTLAAELSQARPDLATKLYLPEHGEGWARRLGLAFSCVPENVRCRRDLLSDWVAEALEADKPEVLIVDCFPIRVLTPRNYHVKKFLYQPKYGFTSGCSKSLQGGLGWGRNLQGDLFLGVLIPRCA